MEEISRETREKFQIEKLKKNTWNIYIQKKEAKQKPK